MVLNFKYVLFLAAMLLVGCVDKVRTHDIDGYEHGFFSGVFHGVIIVISFIVSLFNSEASIYACSNNGFMYDLGYIVGFAIIYRLSLLEKKPQKVLQD